MRTMLSNHHSPCGGGGACSGDASSHPRHLNCHLPAVSRALQPH